MEFMATVPDKYFDLAIVDPPYGININPNMGLRKGLHKRHKLIKWDDHIPTEECFNELFRISKDQIIWGGQYFKLPPYYHFIFWDKLNPDGLSFSDGELAWTSFNKANRKYVKRNNYDGKIHPTEKHIDLYKWLLKNYAKPEYKIFDSHLGSASSAIAAYDFGIAEFVGTEIDKDYFDAAVKRFENHKLQQTIKL